ncbi:hypothetical protein [Endozoicomonas sp. GU-1]|uniref:hypothetical protein n=1 Tax=Endozoicomonas sp. GU-1 TaxID=3009078 RepID=UPI0022B5CC0F|nr:hypothetical protein [Endozoicomonas sp. GU-1]WBA80949.1 hypothetical protein O2T12_22015 [Endozoicomonas sp. GU-1]WBA88517.1 hypothetical protein O3276_11220 [Endozoicomonas sp. GU-1]
MNNFNSYFGQSGSYPAPDQLSQKSMPDRPQQPPFSPASKTTKTANGLPCASAQPTSFMHQATAQPKDDSPSCPPQPTRSVCYREVTQYKQTTFEATTEELLKFCPNALLAQGFTEIPFVDDLLLASLPDQPALQVLHTSSTVKLNRNWHTQPVSAQRHSSVGEPDSGRPYHQYHQSHRHPHRNRREGI